MKKIIIVMALILTPMLLCGGCLGLLYFGNLAGQKSQADFFETIETGNASQVMAMMHPDLKEYIDEPVFAVWLKAFNETLGSYQGTSGIGFNTNASFENGNWITKSQSNVQFQNGTVDSELSYIGDQLIQYELEFSNPLNNWFENGPEDTSMYRQRSLEFYQDIADNKIESARNRMRKELQKEVSLVQLTEMRTAVGNEIGEIRNIEVTSDEFTDGTPQKLTVHLLIEGAKGNMDATVVFHVLGFQMVLLEFEMVPQGEGAEGLSDVFK